MSTVRSSLKLRTSSMNISHANTSPLHKLKIVVSCETTGNISSTLTHCFHTFSHRFQHYLGHTGGTEPYVCPTEMPACLPFLLPLLQRSMGLTPAASYDLPRNVSVEKPHHSHSQLQSSSTFPLTCTIVVLRFRSTPCGATQDTVGD